MQPPDKRQKIGVNQEHAISKSVQISKVSELLCISPVTDVVQMASGSALWQMDLLASSGDHLRSYVTYCANQWPLTCVGADEPGWENVIRISEGKLMLSGSGKSKVVSESLEEITDHGFILDEKTLHLCAGLQVTSSKICLPPKVAIYEGLITQVVSFKQIYYCLLLGDQNIYEIKTSDLTLVKTKFEATALASGPTHLLAACP
jgi:hypothetical protein